MLQDKKGIMWFATWDGINRFDGYNFQVFKARQGDLISLTNNRVDYLKEDVYGFIWAITYDNRVHRFDPRTETFIQVPGKGSAGNVNITKMFPLTDGSMWLITENDGAVRVQTNPVTYAVNSYWYSPRIGSFASSKINKVYLDRQGNEWILSGNGLGLLRKGQTRPTMFFTEPNRNMSLDQSFYDVQETKSEIIFTSDHGRLWRYNKAKGQFSLTQLSTVSYIRTANLISHQEMVLGTAFDGFYILNIQTGEQTHYNTVTAAALPSDQILHTYVDRYKEVWFDLGGGAVGVTHFNPFTHRIKQEIVSAEFGAAARSHPSFNIHEDVNGYLWVHPYGGGFSYYDRVAGKLKPFFNQPGSPDYRFSNKIHSVMSDRQGNLWLCTHSKGLEKITFVKSQFQLLAPSGKSGESLRNDTRAFYQDRDGNLWVGTKDGALYLYNKKMQNMGHLTSAGTISHSGDNMDGVAYSVTQDHNGVIWIGTKGAGLIRAVKSGGRYQLTRYCYKKDDLYSLSDDNIYCVFEDHCHRLWIATYGGGINYMVYRNGQASFINYRNNLKGYPIDQCYRARYITDDHQHHLYVATTSGAVVFNENFSKPEDVRFSYYYRQPGVATTLSNNDVHWVYTTRKGITFLATFGGGLDRLIAADGKNAKFKCYTIKDGLPSDVLLSMREDNLGCLWISTENGITKFDPTTEQFENYSDYSSVFKAQFNEAASFKLQDGSMVFGTNSGIFFFNPAHTRKSNYKPFISFSHLQIANRIVSPNDEGYDSSLPVNLDYLNLLKLSHKQNTITIRYAALDYKNPGNIQYAYKLEGFDNDWSYVDKQRQATYTNLPKGTYVFKVKSTNSDGVWVNNERMLKIQVLPSFWETPWAYILYFLIIVIIIFISVYLLFTFYRLKNEVSVEQQVSDIKLRFFTDISHELRTPLTLIAGPVELILKDKNVSPQVYEQLHLVKKNIDRMLRLVNQILDLRKIQNNKMNMRVSEIEIAPFVQHIMESFDTLAQEHNIAYVFENEADQEKLWVDADKLEKIVFNLLSNAFKYTPQDQSINVFIRDEDTTVAIGVADKGIGIAEGKQDRLFRRFESLMDKNLFNLPTSGIGLSLVKQLVDMHHATITVDSHEGEGSCFVVHLRKGKEHFSKDSIEYILSDSSSLSEDISAEEDLRDESERVAQDLFDEESGEQDILPTILLVEDNADLRSFLCSIFRNTYRVIEAGDGKQGFDRAISEVPDFIISDVMMPVCDGICMTRDLRQDLRTSHIPLILLTAKSAIESKLAGLETGADDYITKPFSATYLKARVDNILKRRIKLREYFRDQLLEVPASANKPTEKEDHLDMSPSDRRFMDKLIELMNQNMDNGDLVVDDLVQEMAVSRSVFFKKLKTLIGLSPIEFIKEVRVNRAAQLIRDGEYNMTQISYMVGINDPRYFSKCFKQKFNMTPTKYKESL